MSQLAHWSPLITNGRSLEPTGLILELTAWSKLAIGGEGPWSGWWPRTQWPLWQNASIPLWRWEKLLDGQLNLQHCIDPAFMVEWPDRSNSSVKVTLQSCKFVSLEFVKRHRKDLPDHEKQNDLFWWDIDWTLWSECQAPCKKETRHCLIPGQYHPNCGAWWRQHLAVLFFSVAGTGWLVRIKVSEQM